MSLMMGDDTWKCAVCHTERPDEKISVAQHTHVNGLGVEMKENVKFCNDNQQCKHDAMLHGLRDLAAIDTTMEARSLRAELDGVKSSTALTLVIIAGIALSAGIILGKVILS